MFAPFVKKKQFSGGFSAGVGQLYAAIDMWIFIVDFTSVVTNKEISGNNLTLIVSIVCILFTKMFVL